VAQGSGAITAGTQLNRDLGNATIWIDRPAIDEDAIPLDLDLAYLHLRWCVGRDRADSNRCAYDRGAEAIVVDRRDDGYVGLVTE